MKDKFNNEIKTNDLVLYVCDKSVIPGIYLEDHYTHINVMLLHNAKSQRISRIKRYHLVKYDKSLLDPGHLDVYTKLLNILNSDINTHSPKD